ncbi:hypothetical protein PR048_020724 [Dryococelus australis]|uniref:Uncharacterized protein n=1 Tax=Dryococelus australis TaxID=614101 RepID=A0ABQ9H795_9NEOP|nr:hypothetical protein PR048_020724 [Dryococelus australis]
MAIKTAIPEPLTAEAAIQLPSCPLAHYAISAAHPCSTKRTTQELSMLTAIGKCCQQLVWVGKLGFMAEINGHLIWEPRGSRVDDTVSLPVHRRLEQQQGSGAAVSRRQSTRWPSQDGAALGMQGREKRKYPEKVRSQAASSSTIPTCENPEVNPPGIEPGSPWWELHLIFWLFSFWTIVRVWWGFAGLSASA